MKKLLLNLDDIISSIALIGITFITLLGVFMRYILENPLKWGEEFVLALTVWFVFVGYSSVMKRNMHISVDFFVARLPQKAQKAMEIFRYAVVSILTVIIFIILGYQLADLGWQKWTSILRIPYFYINLSLVVGGILAMLHIIRMTIGKRTGQGE